MLKTRQLLHSLCYILIEITVKGVIMLLYYRKIPNLLTETEREREKYNKYHKQVYITF